MYLRVEYIYIYIDLLTDSSTNITIPLILKPKNWLYTNKQLRSCMTLIPENSQFCSTSYYWHILTLFIFVDHTPIDYYLRLT